MDEHRKHLTRAEVAKLIAVAGQGRNAARDRCFILLMFRHGLRVSEACGLKLSQVDSESRQLHVGRLKNGIPTTHPLRPDELRAIKEWLRVRAVMQPGPKCEAFFISERRKALSRVTAWWSIKKHGAAAGLALPSHPHMLRHACGYDLAEQGADAFLIRDYLGHRKIENTSQYVAGNPVRFEKLWRT